jgi:hypothetical protein
MGIISASIPGAPGRGGGEGQNGGMNCEILLKVSKTKRTFDINIKVGGYSGKVLA